MRINNIPVAGLNPSSRLIPYNDGSGFTDSPIEVIPPFEGFEGQGGLQTHIGSFILAPPTLSIPPFGFKFVNNFIQGSLSQIGDVSGFSQTSMLQIQQFPGNPLYDFSLTDYYNNQKYINIVPNSTIFGIGNDATSSSNMYAGFIIDGASGIGACYLGQRFGLEFSPLFREVKIGDMANNEFIGVDTHTPAMLVSSTLMDNPPVRDIVNFIRVRDESNNFYYIPLYN